MKSILSMVQIKVNRIYLMKATKIKRPMEKVNQRTQCDKLQKNTMISYNLLPWSTIQIA